MAAPHRFVDPTDFDLRLLRVFDAVARAGSFTAGEVMLNKSKSSISMDIAALETRLGLKLCRRGRAGFALTEHGRAIHDLCGELFRSLHDFRDRVGRVASHVGGSVTVVMDDNFPFGVQAELTGVVRSFNDAHPDVFLTLRTSSPDEVTQLIVDGSVDLGISAIPKPVPETQQHALFEEVMTLYCGARHPLFDVPDARLKRKQVAGFAFVDVASRQSPQAREFADEMRVAARAAAASPGEINPASHATTNSSSSSTVTQPSGPRYGSSSRSTNCHSPPTTTGGVHTSTLMNARSPSAVHCAIHQPDDGIKCKTAKPVERLPCPTSHSVITPSTSARNKLPCGLNSQRPKISRANSYADQRAKPFGRLIFRMTVVLKTKLHYWHNVRRISCARTGYRVSTDNVGRGSLMRSLDVLRHVASADARFQLVKDRVQPTLAHLTSGHLEQDRAYFRRGVHDCPADFSITNTGVASVVELKRQRGIGRRADNMLGLLDIRQGMGVGARRSRAGSTSGGSCGRVANLACGGMCRQGKETQLRGALSPTGKGPDAFNRRTGPCICGSVRLIQRKRPLSAIRSPASNHPE